MEIIVIGGDYPFDNNHHNVVTTMKGADLTSGSHHQLLVSCGSLVGFLLCLAPDTTASRRNAAAIGKMLILNGTCACCCYCCLLLLLCGSSCFHLHLLLRVHLWLTSLPILKCFVQFTIFFYKVLNKFYVKYMNI